MSISSNRWYLGARPRTLPAAVVPVALGSAVAFHEGGFIWWHAVAALVVSLALQVGTNYANDYSDGIRGTDEVRVGPVRLVASKLASPASVKRAAFMAFGVAAVVGTALSLVVDPWLILVVGIPSVLAGWFYTGGSRPYGYSGFGELFVFVFFGLVATLGSQYVHAKEVTSLGFDAAVCAGLLAMALLVVNNLRDIPGDTTAGKKTLAVRLGDKKTRLLYVACLGLPFVVVLAAATEQVWVLLGLVAIALAIAPIRNVLRGDKGRELIATLGATGKLQLGFAALFAIGVML